MAPFGRILWVSTDLRIELILGKMCMKSMPEILTISLASPLSTSTDNKPTKDDILS